MSSYEGKSDSSDDEEKRSRESESDSDYEDESDYEGESDNELYIEGISLTAGDWDNINDDKIIVKELKFVTRLAWDILFAYHYQEYLTEIVSIMKCTHRLIHLFLSDNIKSIYRFGDEMYRLYLALSALKISWNILAQHDKEDLELFDINLAEIRDKNYQWIIDDSPSRRRMLIFEFQLLKYPYQRCFSYMQYEPMTKQQFIDEVKDLVKQQIDIDLTDDDIIKYYPDTIDAISHDQSRMDDYLQFHHEDVKGYENSFFDLPPLQKMGEKL